MDTKLITLKLCKERLQECIKMIDRLLDDSPKDPSGPTPDVGGGQIPPPPGSKGGGG